STYINSAIPHVVHGIVVSHIVGGVVHVFRHHRHPMDKALRRRLIALRPAASRSARHRTTLVAVTRGTCAASRYVMRRLRGRPDKGGGLLKQTDNVGVRIESLLKSAEINKLSF
ncbi:hypothetical protein WDU94_004771, partial [Cyamophila willieti]